MTASNRAQRKGSTVNWVIWFEDTDVVRLMSDRGNKSLTVKHDIFDKNWIRTTPTKEI